MARVTVFAVHARSVSLSPSRAGIVEPIGAFRMVADEQLDTMMARLVAELHAMRGRQVFPGVDADAEGGIEELRAEQRRRGAPAPGGEPEP